MYVYLLPGYPYNITKSAVVSIAPHSWPLLLHALLWQTKAILEVMNFTCIESPDVVRLSIRSLHSLQCYKLLSLYYAPIVAPFRYEAYFRLNY